MKQDTDEEMFLGAVVRVLANGFCFLLDHSRPLRVREKKGHLESTVEVGDCEFTGSSNS